MEYLHLQAPAACSPAFAQVIGLKVRPEPVQEHTLLVPSGVEQRLCWRQSYGVPCGFLRCFGLE